MRNQLLVLHLFLCILNVFGVTYMHPDELVQVHFLTLMENYENQ